MTVKAIRKDPQSRTMTLEAEFDAAPERVWQLWAIRASSSAGGDHRRTQRRSTLTTCAPAATSSTT